MIYYILLGRILQLPRGKGHKRTSRSYSKVPHLTHPPSHIRKTATAPGSPYSFRIVRGFLSQNYQHARNCETGPPPYRPRKSSHLQMKLQRQHFLLSYLKTLSVGPVGVSNSRPPRHSPVHNQESLVHNQESHRSAVVRWNIIFSDVWNLEHDFCAVKVRV